MINVDVDIKPILKVLEQFPEKFRQEMLNDAVRAGANLIKKETKKRVRRGATGNLGRSLATVKLRSPNPNIIRYGVGFKTGGGKNASGYHAHLVEFGHVVWRRKKRGRGAQSSGKKYEMEPTSKRAKATPMLGPAFRMNRRKVLQEMIRNLGADKIEKKILKKLRTRARVRR